jgi:cytochrome c553
MPKYSFGPPIHPGIMPSEGVSRAPLKGDAMKKTLVVLAGLAAAFAASAQDRPYFVANCFACHGTDGRSSGAIPALAGMNKDYFVEQIRLFKSGGRQGTVMGQLAKGYTDEEMAVAADYFAKQKK